MKYSLGLSSIEKYIPKDIQRLYEIHDFKHAAAILSQDFPKHFEEICQVLREFRFTKEDILKAGGNESEIPKKFSGILRPLGWEESQLKVKLTIGDEEVEQDTHKIDFVKGRIAFDLEWNSKDQTFDRDLFAFRTFHENNKISVGILVTRSNELDPWFDKLGTYKDKHNDERTVKSKYGASTTHMGKLLPRIKAQRGGGCPILVFGITTNLLKK